MTKRLAAPLLFFLLSPLAAGAERGRFNPKGPSCTFKDFMTAFVRAEKKAPAVDTFLVADAVEHPDGEFWVYWPQGRQILLVGWPVEDCRDPALVIRRRLDLDKDVVKTDADIGGSTYLVTEDWAGRVLFAAAKSGYQVTVRK